MILTNIKQIQTLKCLGKQQAYELNFYPYLFQTLIFIMGDCIYKSNNKRNAGDSLTKKPNGMYQRPIF